MLQWLRQLVLTSALACICLASHAQQPSDGFPVAPYSASSRPEQQALLIPDPVLPLAVGIRQQWYTIENLASHQGRLASLILLPPLSGAINHADSQIELLLADNSVLLADQDSEILLDDYPRLQQVLQERELLFWQIPFWTVVINLLSALVLLLVALKQAYLPLFKWLISSALLGNFYFAAYIAPGVFHPALITIAVTAWLYCVVRLLVRSQALSSSNRDSATRALQAALVLILLTVACDGLLLWADVSLPAHQGMRPQLVPAAQLIALLAALNFLVCRHADTRAELENLNASLDNRVKTASAELQQRYQQLKKDSLDAAGLNERRNIYQSIHEDLSDKLLHLIYSASAADTADLARSALAELRDSRNLIPDQNTPLEDLLADARSEIQIRCDQAGILLDWQQDEDLQDILLNARQGSALSRTLREAFSNLLKHASASTAHVSIHKRSPTELVYRIQDNGVGMASRTHPGRGLVNMQSRIAEIGGTLDVTTSEQAGTTLEFLLPIPAATADTSIDWSAA